MKENTFTITVTYHEEDDKYKARILGVKAEEFEISNCDLKRLKEEVKNLLPVMLPHIIDLETCISMEEYDIVLEV